MAAGKAGETLISFESGHYKKVTGIWKGDSVWTYFMKDSGGMVHINKDKVEYMESFGEGENPSYNNRKKIYDKVESGEPNTCTKTC